MLCYNVKKSAIKPSSLKGGIYAKFKIKKILGVLFIYLFNANKCGYDYRLYSHFSFFNQ